MAKYFILSFDDGTIYDRRFVELLNQYGIKGTFNLNSGLEDFVWHYEDRFPVRRQILSETGDLYRGHEIASHTYSHKDLKTLSKEAVISEVVKARDNLYALTGEYPTYIRPPYGGYNNLVKEYAYAPLINWDLDSKDWSFRDVDKIVEHVLKEVENRNIILMHDIHWFTVDAVERLLPELAAQGYQFVTVSELFYYNNVEKVNGKVYYGGYN
jgi:peptidoglycan/xylan/chitin deacetylase (PgdA/CDA1 family)